MAVSARPEQLIPALLAVQHEQGWLPPAELQRLVAEGHAPAAVAGVSTFYDRFRHRPAGRHLIAVCHGTACHVRGAELVEAALRRALGIADGEDTDPARTATLLPVACLGCCTLAPVIEADGTVHGRVDAAAVPTLAAAVIAASRVAPAPPRAAASAFATLLFRIGGGSCCVANGAGRVREALEQAVAAQGGGARVVEVGCAGLCHRTPLVEVVGAGAGPVRYERVDAALAEAIVRRHLRPAGTLARLRRGALTVVERVGGIQPPLAATDAAFAPFLAPQVRLATDGGGEVEPLALDAWLARGAFAALRRALAARDPAALVAEVAASGLRGRGGAGFPTGRKWAAVRAAPPGARLVVCNGDEGDPGAFMDRMLLESFPFRVIEGLALAALAVGAEEGLFYIRAEYPLAVRRVRAAIAVLEARGWLGAALLGDGPPLRLRVVEGAGAFVCGEETALLASVEGRRGTPRLRPPYPAQSGAWGRPTLVNNVETLALVPWIVAHGAAAFAAHGTAGSAGTKVFALAGKVARGGLVEVPMGMTLRRIVEEVGGGIAGGDSFKAVQIGGPSGGCLPAAACDLPVDYEALTGAGAIMGSGGLVVLDQRDCMVDLARYFLRFTQEQSCGRCSLCRLGTRRMLAILERLCAGTAVRAELDELEELARTVQAGSLCGLGQTAPNPVLSTLRHFRDEYLAHLDGRCPAGRCAALTTYRVTGPCTGCTRCGQACPVAAIAGGPLLRHVIDEQVCIRCDACRAACPEDAIETVPVGAQR